MKTLIIYDSCGEEELAFYLIDDAPEWLDKCHMKFRGGCYDDEPDCDEIESALANVDGAVCDERWEDDYREEMSDKELCGAWRKCRVDSLKPFAITADKVIITGRIP